MLMNDTEKARKIIDGAIAELGSDLCGYSAVDLLLDNMPGLRGSDDARRLLHTINRSTLTWDRCSDPTWEV